MPTCWNNRYNENVLLVRHAAKKEKLEEDPKASPFKNLPIFPTFSPYRLISLIKSKSVYKKTALEIPFFEKRFSMNNKT